MALLQMSTFVQLPSTIRLFTTDTNIFICGLRAVELAIRSKELFSFVGLVGQWYHLIPAQPARAFALIGDLSFTVKETITYPLKSSGLSV